ncbi:MAG: MATE family efflux transporter [Desulfarculales bacterium]|jgi:MATE family multidrug resistance protein|nr:MATE family efflux transporter [Desulfarculales bacterium]
MPSLSSMPSGFFSLWRQHRRGYAQILKMSLPLIVGMGSSTVMQLTDRIFLANYSLTAMAAAMPAGIAAFVPTAFFMGVGTYVNVFIAHYCGAKSKQRIGPALWAGIYFSLISGGVLALLSLTSPLLFSAGGHPLPVREMENIYCGTLLLGGGFNVLMAVLGCFYSGQGITRPIMLINLAGMCLNVPLTYLLINGAGPFPELGILGSALATVIAWIFECLVFAALIFTPANMPVFNLRPAWPKPGLLRRLSRFGLPNGVHFMADMAAFAVFVFLVGRMGLNSLAATNIVFSINQIAFMPLLGLGMAVSILVGQSLGASRIAAARLAADQALHLAMVYMLIIALWFMLAPLPLLELFRPRDMSPEEFLVISGTGADMLRLVALYCIFDAFTIVYAGALKATGDTRFIMLIMLLCALLVMIMPTVLAVRFDWGIMFSWYAMTAYVCLLGLIYWLRFRSKAWEGIEVVGKEEGNI